ncbi:MAG: radical SAM protein [Candidatus Symbiodolus clandestinus]
MTVLTGKKIKHLEIILKISERCNINCTYCYVFNMGSSLAADSPPIISIDNVIALKGFLERSAAENDIDVIQVDFHGGEPLMMKKNRFDQMCEILLHGNYGNSRLALALQTNGILVDEEWIALFEKHKVHASISIDGPKHINDRHRLDRKEKSTYEGTVNGLRLLQNAFVMQYDKLFRASLMDNISSFDPCPDIDWMYKCAAAAAIHDEIMAMPMQYETMVGDIGSILSGGQKQRVSLARALYKRPRILFLDEATSDLAVFNEQKINQAVKQMLITRVFAAHRPEMITVADRVYHLMNKTFV